MIYVRGAGPQWRSRKIEEFSVEAQRVVKIDKDFGQGSSNAAAAIYSTNQRTPQIKMDAITAPLQHPTTHSLDTPGA
jgi:hypothetical protein